ncbi:MAG: hypothetical protein QME81_04590 [bacterium]|nr:hypothetical protein [bacterium]
MIRTLERIDVSIPNPIFKSAEQLAKRLGMSLSKFYTAALATYVESHQGADVTERLNRIYETESSTLDHGLIKIQAASLEGETWWGTDNEHGAWLRLSGQRLEDAYGEDEPEYSLDLLKEVNPDYEAR